VILSVYSPNGRLTWTAPLITHKAQEFGKSIRSLPRQWGIAGGGGWVCRVVRSYDQMAPRIAPVHPHGFDSLRLGQSTDCADANGNVNSTTNCSNGYGYDVENRIVSVPGNTAYGYALGNKRVWRGTTSANHLTLDELTFWSVTGQKTGKPIPFREETRL
jgi:hypothetical protein